jgi:uncharacterized protein (UPF0261 family)
VRTVYIVGTYDTKSRELTYLADLIRNAGVAVCTVDVSSRPFSGVTDVSNEEVAGYHPDYQQFLGSVDDRGEAVTLMSQALAEFLLTRADLGGIIGIGGSGNTALVTAAMQRLPVGLPKLMVSTVASGNVAPYVGPCDITMMYSVTDVAGLNRISRVVLGNAAHAIAGMVAHSIPKDPGEKPLVGMTMYGVTTPCVAAVRDNLEHEFEPLVFHATGTGGRSMENLIDAEMMSRVIDVTTTEIADHVAGGFMSAGPDRLGAVIRRGIPYVGSAGALDMVTFGPPETVPSRLSGRTFYQHNASITLMRTNVEESTAIGRWIGERLNLMSAGVRFLLPEKGLSLLGVEGMKFHDPEADDALFRAIEDTVRCTDRRQVIRYPYTINDPRFAEALLAAFREIHPPGRPLSG